MITDKEETILLNAPEGAEYFIYMYGERDNFYATKEIHGICEYYLSMGITGENTATTCGAISSIVLLSDLRKKQGKTVVDAVNYHGANADFLTSGYLIYMNKKWAQASGGDWLEYKVCTIEEFNQCVKERSEFAGKYEYEQYLAQIDIFGIDKLEPIKEDKISCPVCYFAVFPSQQLCGNCGQYLHAEKKDKPRTKVECVLIDKNGDNGSFWECARDFSLGHEFSQTYDCPSHRSVKDNDMLLLCYKANALYRKVETEIKEEKRWFAYNSKTNMMQTKGYPTKDDCYRTLHGNRFQDVYQYIEITVEV